MLAVITKEAYSELEDRILRPLSAKLLPPTLAEREGIVDREKLLAIHGRSRSAQMALAEERGINDYPCPAGGCLLTDVGFVKRMTDLMQHKPDFNLNDVELLKIGRHLRLSAETVVIVGRNESENALIRALAAPSEWLLEVKACGSPLALLRGAAGAAEIGRAAAITVRYSDAPPPGATVHCATTDGRAAQLVWAAPLGEAELAALRI